MAVNAGTNHDDAETPFSSLISAQGHNTHPVKGLWTSQLPYLLRRDRRRVVHGWGIHPVVPTHYACSSPSGRRG